MSTIDFIPRGTVTTALATAEQYTIVPGNEFIEISPNVVEFILPTFTIPYGFSSLVYMPTGGIPFICTGSATIRLPNGIIVTEFTPGPDETYFVLTYAAGIYFLNRAGENPVPQPNVSNRSLKSSHDIRRNFSTQATFRFKNSSGTIILDGFLGTVRLSVFANVAYVLIGGINGTGIIQPFDRMEITLNTPIFEDYVPNVPQDILFAITASIDDNEVVPVVGTLSVQQSNFLSVIFNTNLIGIFGVVRNASSYYVVDYSV